ncbi:hypothetical protein BSK59_13760 [Paenibacillus odorifer]|uniref:hypothetical protein n=1 Tax=Paenibacillus odorifer TaxID=189426 RepID=UPI00096D9329|nr:hypothetical protein [Paenibacillus odorifer]OME55537.1 hypothetical protein BSK59_13760 [Paenibacillus odorifer]
MKKLYFDFDNGKVVDPRGITAPAYYAVLDEWSGIEELYVCFCDDKLEQNGSIWSDSILHKHCYEWVNYSLLMTTLKGYILYSIRDGIQPDFEEIFKGRFSYLKFWKSQT